MGSERTAPLVLVPLLLAAGTLALPAPPPRGGPPVLWTAGHPTSGGPPDAVPGEVIVKFRAGASLRDRDEARGRERADRRRRFRMGAEQWSLATGASVPQTIDRLRRDPRVAWVEPNYRVHALRAPDDARYPEQWALHNTGQDQGQPGADIRAETAWESVTGSRDVLVAVIDTGIDYTHPDLAANIWDNEGEIAGNGVDDDGNGLVDDVRGWDFVNGDNDPFDDAGHGTHVAGIIGAAGGNHEGIAGVAWQVRLMPVKFLGADGGGTTADAVAAVEYATRMGARIMNNSWGGPGFSEALLEAIEAARAADSLFVVAAGNSGSNNDILPAYPANYDVPNVLSVAASDRFDHLASFSNYGADSVDLAAPGAEILSTVPGARYAVHSGTSMAAPHVTGVAALVRAAAPEIDVVTLRRRLLTQVDVLPGLAGAVATGGRLDAGLAVASPDAVPPAPITDLAVESTSSSTVTLRWTATGDDGAQGTAQSYELRYATFPIDADTFDEATPFAGVAAPRVSGTPESVEVTGLLPETQYAFAIRARDEWGNPGALGDFAVGTTLPPPRLATAPAEFSADLLTGQAVTRILTITNTGDGTLDWTIPAPRVGPQQPGEPVRPGPGLLGIGGPDPFGYRFIDSDEPAGPVFTWTDLRADGTDTGLTGDDTVSIAIPLGFEFPFYGERYGSVRIGSNGLLSFTSASTAYTNQPLPDQNAPENLVAPFWDDLFLTPESKVVYRRDAGRFRVQYDAVMHYDGTGPDTFQVELNAAGEIDFRYRRLEGNRLSATVGIQDSTRSRGLQVVFNAPYLHDDLAVHIDAVPQWLSAAPGRGRLGPSQSAQVSVAIDAGRLPGGAYEGSVLVLSNDPDEPLREHPVSLRVTDAPAIAAAPAIVEFGTVFAGFASQQLVTLRNTGTTRLSVAGAGAGAPAVTAVGAPVAIDPGASADLTVIWSPAQPATLDAGLTVTSDAANQPALVVPLHGSAITPPSIGVAPAALVETVTSGNAITRSLALTNAGPTGLDFRIRALAGPAGVSAGSSAAVFERLADSPQPVTCLAGDPDAGLVYCQETLGSGFMRHRLSGGTWEALAPAPFGAGEEAGAALLGGRLYVSYAGRNTQIAVYDIAARTWSTRAHPLGLGTAAVASDGAGAIYFLGANSFVRYDPVTGAIASLPAPPFVFGFRGGLRYFEGSLYGHPGGGSTAFARYDIAGRTWETLASIPGGAGLGATLDPFSREYAATASGGRGVARYAFEARAWSVTAVPLFPTGDGGLVWMPSPAPGLLIAQGRDGRRCVRLSTAPGFVTLDASTGRVPGAGTIGVGVRLDSAGLAAGDHRAALLVESNDPRAPAVTVPVSLTVLGAPDLRLLGDTVTVESTETYVGAGATTTHTLTLAGPPGDGGTLTLVAEGDYGDAGERAAIGVEGIDLGSAGGAASDCAAATASFPLSDALLSTLAADGRIEVQVRNSTDVGDLCGLNRHTVRLAYAAPVDRIEFGEVFTGLAGGRAIVLRNQGTSPLAITSVTAAPAAFAPAVGAATLQPGESLRLEVRLTPPGPGPIEGTLLIASDDPDRPSIEVPLHGVGVTAPHAVIQPTSVARTLLTNQSAVETLTLSNTGAGPLHFSVEGRAAADAPGCVPTRLLATQYDGGSLVSVDLLTGAVAPVAFGLAGPGLGLDVDARAGVAYLVETDTGAVDAVDLGTGSVRVVASGFSFPYGLAFDATRQRLFVNDAVPGTIVEVDPHTGAAITRAGGLVGGADLAMSPDGGTLYVADGGAGRLLRMDTTTGALETLAFGLGAVAGLALDPPANRALIAVSEPAPGRLLAVDLSGGTVSVVSSGLTRPTGVALSPGHGIAWVTERAPDRVTAVDLATGARSPAAPLPSNPVGLALQPDPRCRVDFLQAGPFTGVVPPGGTTGIEVRLDAAGLGSGEYDGVVAIATDDPSARSIMVPARLTVVGAPDLEIGGEEVRLESALNFLGTGATTTHLFNAPVPPGGPATIQLDADGDFGSAGETASLSVEGNVLGSAGGIENDCQPAHATFTLATAPFVAAAADGVVRVTVRNSADVQQVCFVSRHTVRLQYNAPGDRIDFASERIGSSAVRSIALFNRGSDPLEVASIVSDTPVFAIASGPFRIEPGAARTVEVRFTPLADGPIDATLTITSDDPDEAVVVVPMHGAGHIAPIAGIDPTAITRTLASGSTEEQIVRITNTGGSSLTFGATLGPLAAAGAGAGVSAGVGVGAGAGAGAESAAEIAPETGPGAAAAGASVLLVQEMLPWEADTDAQSLGYLGIPFTRSTAAGLANLDLSGYRLIIVAGDQKTPFYATLAARMPRLTDWVAAGGVLEFHAAAWGTNAGDASEVVLPGGMRIEEAPSPTNTLLDSSHPLTSVLPATLEAHWASHAHFRGVPAGATRLALDAAQVETLVFYRYGVGAVIAAGQPVEFLRAQAHPFGNLLTNALQWETSTLIPPWLSVTPASGVVPPGGEASITLTLRGGSLPVDTYRAALTLRTDDPSRPVTDIPVALTIVGAPRLALLGEERTVSSTKPFLQSGQTEHHLLLPVPPGAEGRLSVIANGDFGATHEFADVVVEGTVIGRVGGEGIDCAANFNSFALSASRMSAIAADQVANVTVTNSATVETFCSVNSHTVTLIYNMAADRVDFGTQAAGAQATRHLTLANTGSEFLSVTLQAGGEEFSVAPTSATIFPGARIDLEVRASSDTVGLHTGNLRMTSNDPSAPLVDVPLSVRIAGAPVAGIDPAALTLSIQAGAQESRFLTLTNSGAGDLSFRTVVSYPPEEAGLSFAGVGPTTGLVPPGGSVSLSVVFNALFVPLGVHRANIGVFTNDPVRPVFQIPVVMTVLPGAHLELSPAALDFGTGFIGLAETRSLLVTNQGTQPLVVQVTGIEPDIFTARPPSLLVTPGQSEFLSVTLEARASGTFPGVLRLASSDPLHPEVEVPLSATIAATPQVNVWPESLVARLPENASTDLTLSILNAGEATMNFSAHTVIPHSWCTASSVYFGDRSGGAIRRLDLAGGPVASVVNQQLDPRLGLVVDSASERAWATDFANGRLLEVDLGVGSVRTAGSGLIQPTGLAVDVFRGLAYVVENSVGRVTQVTLATGEKRIVAGGLDTPTGIALSPDGIRMYIGSTAGTLTEVDLEDGGLRQIRPGLGLVLGVAINQTGEIAYLVDGSTGTIRSVNIEMRTTAVVACCTPGAVGIAVDADDRRLYVGAGSHLYTVDVVDASIADLLGGAFNMTGIALGFDPGCAGGFADLIPATGRVEPQSTLDLTLRINTHHLSPGTYQGSVEVDSNDPVHPHVSVPLTLEVLGDRDHDGTLDPDDNCPDLPNPDQADGDQDRLGDGCDICPTASDPEQRDGDEDGIGDACDPCTDIDHDGSRNPDFPGTCPVDNCPGIANADQADADADGVGDPCDSCTDPDHDGTRSPQYPGDECPIDNCPAMANPLQEDRDVDQIGDLCDACPLDPENDPDADGRCLDRDNCPRVANPEQADADGDALGDVCDNCPIVANAEQSDLDRDGRGDLCDVCPTLFDPDGADLDHDGVGDRCDNCPGEANPDQADRDHDRSGDACQPEVVIESVVETGDVVRVRARLRDPQGDPLRGEVRLFGGFGGKVLLADALATNNCNLVWSPDGVPGRGGIGFANASLGLAALFDADFVLGCENFASDWLIAPGPCSAPTGPFDIVFFLDAVPLPATLCFRSVANESQVVDGKVLGFDDTHLSLDYGGETLPDNHPFEARLPRGIDLSGFEDAKPIRVRIAITDGKTPETFAEVAFERHGQRTLTFGEPPHASIAAAPMTECDAPTGGWVRLDGRASSDPDAPLDPDAGIARFEWLEDPGGAAERALGEGALLDTRLAAGSHRVGLRVTDQDGETALATIDVQVADTRPPVVECAAEVVAECAGPGGATLEPAATAADACGAPTLVNDRGAGGGTAGGIYPIGTTPVVFTATDAAGHAATCTTRVVVRDRVAPTLALHATPATLWPANRRMIPVRVTWESADLCTPAPVVTLVSVTSSDPDVTGRGDPSGDIQGAVPGQPITQLKLRAERLVTAPPRTYTIRYVARDAAGNATPGVAVVRVDRPTGVVR